MSDARTSTYDRVRVVPFYRISVRANKQQTNLDIELGHFLSSGTRGTTYDERTVEPGKQLLKTKGEEKDKKKHICAVCIYEYECARTFLHHPRKGLVLYRVNDDTLGNASVFV